MYTAKDAEALKNRLIAEGTRKSDIIRSLAECCLGWPYVFGAYGQMCTPANRKQFAGYHPEYKSKIYGACPVLSGGNTSSVTPGGATPSPQGESFCAGCKWNGCRIFDCRGFTRWLLEQAGLDLYGGGATSQYETDSNWAVKGEIKEMPRGLVCCVFKRKDGKMSHTGMYLGGGGVIHCSTTVKRGTLNDTPAWTHYGIPAGLYTIDELRKAGVVEPAKNVPTLRRGSEGELVAELQTLLVVWGADIAVDGKFGPATEEAVKAFQREHGLTVDGVVGPKTWEAMGIDHWGEKAPAQDETEDGHFADNRKMISPEDWAALKVAYAEIGRIVKKYEGE